MTPVSHGKPCAGNPHARFDEGASASEKPRRNALLHNKLAKATLLALTVSVVESAVAYLAYQSPGTTEFATMESAADYIWVGSTSGAFAGDDQWQIWQAQDGSSACGIEMTSGDFRIADGVNQTGRLKIESGTYTANKYGDRSLILGVGSGYYWQTSGIVNVPGHVEFGTGAGGYGSFKLTGGEFNITENTWLGIGFANNSSTGVCEITGGAFTMYADGGNGAFVVGREGNGTLTVSGTGTLSTRRIIFGESSGASGTVNLNEGGVIAVKFMAIGEGSGTLNLNGGTLKALQSHDDFIPADEKLSVAIGEEGGVIDTAGFSVTVARPVSGEGALTVTGGGVVKFTQKPTCAVEIENGTAVFTVATTPGSVALGTGGFVEYDLSGETEAGKTVVLAENVAITTSDESPVAEHVIIRNNGELYWNVSYADGSLSATSFAATNGVVTAPTGDFTIFTGYFNGNYPQDQVKSWVNGFPTADTKVIVPSSIPKMQIYVDSATVPCKELVLNGDFAVHGVGKWCNFRPNTVTGNGTLTFSARADAYGYFEAHKGSYDCTVDVPVVLGEYARVSSYPGYLLTFNKSVTFAAGATVNNNAEAAPVFNGDVTVESGARWICSLGTVIASGKTLSGSGTIEGPLELNGIVAPGTNTAETLTVTGAATFNSDSSLLVTIGEDGASSCLALTGEGDVDVANISVDIANKSALVRNSGYEYKVITAENGRLIGRRRGGVKASDGSFWRAEISSDAKSLVLVQSFGGLAVFVR